MKMIIFSKINFKNKIKFKNYIIIKFNIFKNLIKYQNKRDLVNKIFNKNLILNYLINNFFSNNKIKSYVKIILSIVFIFFYTQNYHFLDVNKLELEAKPVLKRKKLTETKNKDLATQSEIDTDLDNITEPLIINVSRNKNYKIENLYKLNSNAEDQSPQISPNGHYLVFQSDRKGLFDGNNLWVSINKNFNNSKAKPNFTKPQLLTFPIKLNEIIFKGNTISESINFGETKNKDDFNPNSDSYEGSPFILYDQDKPIELFYTFSFFEESEFNVKKDYKIYSSALNNINNKWSVPTIIKELYSYYDNTMPCISADGKTMIFTSNRNGGYGVYDLWISKRDSKNSKWSEPQNLSSQINTLYNEITPWLNSKGDLLFFSSDRPGGYGGYDLYMSTYNKNGWSDPVNLGEPINSEFDEESLNFTSNGIWGYFVSNRTAMPDIGIKEVKDYKDLYMINFTGQNYLGTGSLKLYVNLIDSDTKSYLKKPAVIFLTNNSKVKEDKSKIVTHIIDKEKGSQKIQNIYETTLQKMEEYKVVINAEGYLPQEFTFNTGKYLLPNTKKNLIVLLNKRTAEDDLKFSSEDCKSLLPYCLKKIHIYFDQGKLEYKKEEEEKILSIVKILKKYPYLKILIEGHTDSTNSSDYNLKLSLERAKSVYKSLIKNAVPARMLNVYGYGFTRKAVKETTQFEQALNRRVEFVIIE